MQYDNTKTIDSLLDFKLYDFDVTWAKFGLDKFTAKLTNYGQSVYVFCTFDFESDKLKVSYEEDVFIRSSRDEPGAKIVKEFDNLSAMVKDYVEKGPYGFEGDDGGSIFKYIALIEQICNSAITKMFSDCLENSKLFKLIHLQTDGE